LRGDDLWLAEDDGGIDGFRARLDEAVGGEVQIARAARGFGEAIVVGLLSKKNDDGRIGVRILRLIIP
jgi:hypothetical protein